MRNHIHFGRAAILSAALGWILLAAVISERVLAQTNSTSGAKKISVKTAKETAPTPTQPAKGSPETTKSQNPGGGPSAAAATKKPNEPADSPSAATDGSGSLVDGLVDFIRAYAIWILVTLGGLLAIVVAWAYLSQRGPGSPGKRIFEELDLGEKPARTAPPTTQPRYSSTKIQASDVNNRLSKSVKTSEVETDREYALVVDEEALKMPPLPEGSGTSSGRFVDSAPIEQRLEAQDLRGAYEAFANQIQAHQSTAFQGEVERALGDRLLKARELDKAAKVLEHHVATRAHSEIKADVYFNLGYIHFLNRSLDESKRYFKLFVEKGENPVHVARAKKLLAVLKVTPASN